MLVCILIEGVFCCRLLHGVPAGEVVLVAKTLEDALRGVPPLAMVLLAIPPQPLIDESGKPIELRTAHRRRASVPRRNGEREHLPHALARDPEMARRRALAHPVPARQTDLALQLHGVNPPAIPNIWKGLTHWQSFAPPRQDHPAATVV